MARMSLGQATGGRPGKVQRPQQGPRVAARGRPMPGPPKTGPLGLGLGLNAKQRAGFQQAAQQQGGMGSAQWLAQHPQMQQRIAGMGGAQGQKVQDFMQTGQRTPQPPPSQRQAPGAQPAPQRPPMPLGMVGGNMNQGPQGNMAFFGPQGSNMPRPMVNPGMQSVMESRGMPPEMMQQPQQPPQGGMGGQFSPRQFGMDPSAINANPQQAQDYMRQQQMGSQQPMQSMGGFGAQMGNMASQMQGFGGGQQAPSRGGTMYGFGGGGGYSLQGNPPPGMGTGFGGGMGGFGQQMSNIASQNGRGAIGFGNQGSMQFGNDRQMRGF